MKTAKKGSSRRIPVVILVAVILIAIGGAAYYIWFARQHKQVAPAATQGKPIVDVTSQNFTNCQDANGGNITKRNGTLLCTYQGKTYALPTTFDKREIAHLNKVPASAQPLLIASAKNAFDNEVRSIPNGTSTYLQLKQPAVFVAQDNYIDFGVGGHHEYYIKTSATGGIWRDIGTSKFFGGLSCTTTTKYKLTQPTTAYFGTKQTTCIAQNGSIQKLPAAS